MFKSENKKGFTLIEISIVVVVISLVIAGILGGKSLIDSSKKKAIIKEYNEYHKAFQIFFIEYNGWPGDLKTAQDFFGSGVENGDGDGFIEGYSESFYAWEHLAEADLVRGAFTGLASAGGDNIVNGGIDAPSSKYDIKAVNWIPFSFQYSDHGWTSYELYDPKLNLLYLTSNSADSGNWETGVLCNDAHYVDKKIDDELPYSGNLTLWGGTCHLSSISASAEYRKTPHTNKTHMRFLLSNQ